MRDLHGMVARLILIQASTSWRYSDVEDMHDTACLIVQRCAKILAERAQTKLPL